MKIPAWLVRVKFRFDLGQGFLAIINFALIIVAASDKITSLIHLPAKILVVALLPIALFAVWLVGYILDRMDFARRYQDEANHRNEMLKEALNK